MIEQVRQSVNVLVSSTFDGISLLWSMRTWLTETKVRDSFIFLIVSKIRWCTFEGLISESNTMRRISSAQMDVNRLFTTNTVVVWSIQLLKIWLSAMLSLTQLWSKRGFWESVRSSLILISYIYVKIVFWFIFVFLRSWYLRFFLMYRVHFLLVVIFLLVSITSSYAFAILLIKGGFIILSETF